MRELAAALSDKLADPFSHPDMNQNDINWQAVWNAFWEEADDRDAPAAIIAALRAIAGSDT